MDLTEYIDLICSLLDSVTDGQLSIEHGLDVINAYRRDQHPTAYIVTHDDLYFLKSCGIRFQQMQHWMT